jgi:zinc/manganese transport system substrate-binding protein
LTRRSGLRGAALALAAGLAAAALLGSCAPRKVPSGKRAIVVTYSVLGSVVKELVGEAFEVEVLIPDGLDPHEWEPSARDMAALRSAALVVENGLGLEEGLRKSLDDARAAGVGFFTAADHVALRRVGKGEGLPSGDPDQAAGALDPHFWTDPVAMASVADALADRLRADFGLDLSARKADLDARLGALDAEIRADAARLAPADRLLVTGHESMGYFAERYGFRLVGAVVPGLSSQAETSAASLAALERLVVSSGARVIFVELGENPKVARALAEEAKVRSVPLVTHALPKGGDYFAFLRALASTITGALAR